jgi:hypothetical protein
MGRNIHNLPQIKHGIFSVFYLYYVRLSAVLLTTRPKAFYKEAYMLNFIWEVSMKLKLSIIALLITLTSSAFANYFMANPTVTVLPGRVSVQVYNPYYEPIICNGQVFGQTYAGPIFNAFFAEQFMPAGANRFAFVQASPYNPFVGGWANIHCRFLR